MTSIFVTVEQSGMYRDILTCSGLCRYTYFPSSRRQFGLLGPSLLEIDHDERPEDGTLASSLGV